MTRPYRLPGPIWALTAIWYVLTVAVQLQVFG